MGIYAGQRNNEARQHKHICQQAEHAFSQLRVAGLIRFSLKVDDISVQVMFIHDRTQKMWIDGFRNLGYQHLHHHGEPYMCESCGITYIIDAAGGHPKKLSGMRCENINAPDR